MTLTGQYSLVEAYYLSLRHLSRRMVPIGDPLYNSWRTEAFGSNIQSLDLFGQNPLRWAPAERAFPDPIRVQRQVEDERRRALASLP